MLEHNANEVAPGGSRGRNGKPAQPSRSAAEPALPAPAAHPPSKAADDVESLYLEHRSLLLFVASRKFRIPDCDAENLIQEVFLSFLQNSTKIDNIRAWLVAAMCNASRHYWRAQGRTESLPENIDDQCDPTSQGLAEQYTLRMTVHQALNYLQPRCRETLWLHYFEGRSASDVAREMETTVRYAEKLIHNCLKRAREVYVSITSIMKDRTP